MDASLDRRSEGRFGRDRSHFNRVWAGRIDFNPTRGTSTRQRLEVKPLHLPVNFTAHPAR
jgi:hypothetical protein